MTKGIEFYDVKGNLIVQLTRDSRGAYTEQDLNMAADALRLACERRDIGEGDQLNHLMRLSRLGLPDEYILDSYVGLRRE